MNTWRTVEHRTKVGHPAQLFERRSIMLGFNTSKLLAFAIPVSVAFFMVPLAFTLAYVNTASASATFIVIASFVGSCMFAVISWQENAEERKKGRLLFSAFWSWCANLAVLMPWFLAICILIYLPVLGSFARVLLAGVGLGASYAIARLLRAQNRVKQRHGHSSRALSLIIFVLWGGVYGGLSAGASYVASHTVDVRVGTNQCVVPRSLTVDAKGEIIEKAQCSNGVSHSLKEFGYASGGTGVRIRPGSVIMCPIRRTTGPTLAYDFSVITNTMIYETACSVVNP